MGTPKATAGVDVRHTRTGATRTGGECSCTPTFQAHVFDKRTGKRLRKTFATKTAAKLSRQDALVALRAGTLRPAAMAPTVNAALGDLLDGMTNGRILDHSGRPYRPATIRSYRQAADAYLRPLIGDRKLTDLHRRDVQALVDTLRAKGLAASTVLNKLDPLRVVCRRALRDDVIAVDPTKGLELPAQRGRRAPIADVGRAEALLAALDLPDRAAYALFVYAGLRRGEARALRARDVDLEVAVIRVERNLDDAEGEQETKTDAGRRTVPIAGALRRVLAEHLMASGRRGDDLLVGVTATRPFQPTTLRRRALKAWGWRQDRDKLVPSGTVNPPLAPLTPHEGRHVAASFLLAAGVPLFEVSRYVGHTDVRTTANVNGHLVEGQEQEAARRLDELLERPAARQLRDS